MKQKLLNLTRLRSLMLVACVMLGVCAWGETTTYQHVFNAKPSTGNNVVLSGVNWTITAENLNGYNSANYAGVQIGTSKANGNITLTSSSVWGEQTGDYYGKSIITEVRLWLNLGGTSVTPTVTIGGVSATSDGTTVVKNSSAGSDWSKATKVTFTPADNGNTGIVVINVSTVKAGYICAMEIDCEESAAVNTTTAINVPTNFNTDIFNGTEAGTLSATVTDSNNAIDSATVTWASSNNNVARISTSGAVTLVSVGTTIITATYAGVENQYKPSSATYELTVVNNDPNLPGTLNNPFTVAQARSAIQNNNYVANQNYYVRGIVSKFYNTSVIGDNYHRYYISDDGSTTDQILVFNGKGLNQADFTSADDVMLEDLVVICGPLTLYQGTYEINAGNYIVSQLRRDNPGLSYNPTEYNVDISEVSTFTTPTLTNTHNLTVTYSSDNTQLANVNENTGEVQLQASEGVVTITASFAGNDAYKPGSASYTITLTDRTKGTISNPFTVTEVINGKANGKNDIYVRGFIVGEFRSSTLAPYTSNFTTDANIALAAEFTTSPTAAASIPVALPTNALKSAWGCQTNGTALLGYEVLIVGNGETYFSVDGIKGTSFVQAVSVPAAITDAGWATFSNTLALDFTGTDAIEVRTASVAEGNISYNTITKVPANTGVLLRSVQGGAVRINVPVLANNTDPDDITGNMLVAVPTTITGLATAGDNGSTNYILNNVNGVLGFYRAAGNRVDAGKAYLNVPAGASRSFIDINPGEQDGIESVNVNAAEDNIYDLQGRQVAQPQKGLYIVNGKKVVIK